MIRSAVRYLVSPLATLAAALLLGGCSSAQLVETVTVFSDGNCANTKAGITERSLPELRTLRRSRLLPPPDDAPLEPQDELPDLENTRIYVFSKGQQPTPGYGLALEQTSLDDATLTVRFNWQSPPADAVLAQVLTHPCIAIGIPVTGAEVLVAADQKGEFARLEL
ncbi:MAG: protease complex subunit PrcB family protein [Pseudomonadota bacterium]